MDEMMKHQLPNRVRWLAKGPNPEARSFSRYVHNGVKFRTKDNEIGRTTQNSGVCVTVEGGTTYYRRIISIIELNYFGSECFVLFKCDWVDTAIGRGYKVDEFGFELVNFSRLVHTGDRLSDDPFILAPQASQVYYVADERHPNWEVVVKTKPRDVFDAGNDDDIDDYCENEPYNFNVEQILENVQDDLTWFRNEVEGTTLDIPQEFPMVCQISLCFCA